MAQRKKILLFTNSEYGQANVFLATAHDLVLRGDCDVHLSSFPDLEPRVTELSNRLSQPSQAGTSRGTLTFHAIPATPMLPAFQRILDDVNHPPGVKGAIRSFEILDTIVCPWDGPEYVRIYGICVEIIKSLVPAVVVVDNGFSQALDACRTLPWKHVVLSPNTVKDIAGPAQPNLAYFWKYPM